MRVEDCTNEVKALAAGHDQFQHGLLRTLRVLCLALTMWCAGQGALAQELRGRVIAVADGDTLTIRAGREKITVRLQGIDAPEKRQPYGARSKRHLTNLVYTEQVVVLAEKLDRHRRVVAKVLRDGRDIALAQIEAGLAWHYTEYEREQTIVDRRLYAAAEREARNLRRGLWHEPNPQPPWDYRSRKRSATFIAHPSSFILAFHFLILHPSA